MELFQRILTKVVGQEVSKEEMEEVSGAGKVKCEGEKGMATYYSNGKVVCND